MNVNLTKGIFWTIAAIFFYSCGHAASAAISSKIPVHQIQFIKYLSACIFLLLFFGKQPIERPSYLKLYIFRCLVGTGSAFTFMMAIRHLNLFDATLLNMTSPFYLPLIGIVWLKEKCSLLIWPVLALGFCGTALIFPPSSEMFQWGSIFALASGLFSALALSSIRALTQKNESTPKVVFFYMIFGAVVTGLASAFSWSPLAQIDWILGICGGFCLAINQVCLVRSFQFATSSSLAPFAYFSFPFSAGIGWLIFDQPIHNQVLFGAVLIGVTGILTHKIHSMRQTLQN